jgi:hypothetical protein
MPLPIPETEKQETAKLIHHIICNYNHIDYCEWDYGSFTQTGVSREDWLNRAENYLKEGGTLKSLQILAKQKGGKILD